MKRFVLGLLFFSQVIVAKQDNLVVGTTSGYSPYVSLDGSGRYEGFDIDFAQALADKLGRKLIIRDLGSMPSLMVGLQKKKVDLLIWAISITQERKNKMEMVYYQGEKVTEMPCLFWKKIPDGVKKMADLKDRVVSVEAGSFQESVLGGYRDVKVKLVEKVSDGLMELRFGKSEAMIIDPSLVGELTAKNRDLKVARLPLRPEEYALGNGICLNKENQLLIEAVKKGVEELISEGVVTQLEKKWNLGG